MNKLKNISTEKIWILGIGIWFFYALGFVVLAFGLGSDLSFTTQSVFSAYNLIFVLFPLILLIRTIIENSKNKINWLKKSLIFSFVITLLYFLYENFIPHVIIFDPNINDSPFDQWWFSCSQTWYGYPGPFFRILSNETDELGKYILDFTSLTFNLVSFMFMQYVITGLDLIIQFNIVKHRKNNTLQHHIANKEI